MNSYEVIEGKVIEIFPFSPEAKFGKHYDTVGVNDQVNAHVLRQRIKSCYGFFFFISSLFNNDFTSQQQSH